MLSYEVVVDGERVAVAGMADWAVMPVIVSAGRSEPPDKEDIDHTLHIGGMTREIEGSSYHTRWKGPTINVGTEVIIRVVDCDEPDAPTKRFSSDREGQ